MKTHLDIPYVDHASDMQLLDMYLPDTENFDTVIWYHGGGLEAGSRKDNPLTKRLVEKGYGLVSVEYRMYPDAKFPDFLEDGAASVAYILENIRNYGGSGKLFVGGSSAGAYITAMLAFDPKYLDAYNIKTTDIAGYIINSAQMTTHFNVLRERGIDTRRIIVDEAAPVYHISETTDFPNILVFAADNDMPCRLEQNLMFLKTLEMFQCPSEKVHYRLMEGFSHCGYDDTDEFADIILQYMNSVY
ncbi:MAG: alpha/beta hydrolase [Roseburia sp.]|nr:alpha/beta hydrolase [Roseburia sp.]